MKLTVISGRAGSGKSTALRALEDCGFNCIDNFPINLLRDLVNDTLKLPVDDQHDIAVCIDARSRDLDEFPDIMLDLTGSGVECQIIYLNALTGMLVKRFSETRRRHPLTNANTDLLEAIESESQVLAPITNLADLTLDTTNMRSAELVNVISSQIAFQSAPGVSLMFRSFGYKFGVPVDADIVFDLRCLPNPYWEPNLRPLSGLDRPVVSFLGASSNVDTMFDDISNYLQRWVPEFQANNRIYMTVALGCTGGQHRSVYMAERLATHFKDRFVNVLARHRELARNH